MVSQLIRLFWSNIQYFSNIDEIDVAGWPAQQSFFRGSILWNLTLQNEQIWLVKRSFYLLCTLIVLCSPDRKVTQKGHYETPWGSKNVSNILIMTVSIPIRISQLTNLIFYLKNFLIFRNPLFALLMFYCPIKRVPKIVLENLAGSWTLVTGSLNTSLGLTGWFQCWSIAISTVKLDPNTH